MKHLIHPTYFPSIAHFVVMAQQEQNMLFETQDNYQKQTYRNRMVICGANGLQNLNIPVKHQKNSSERLKYKDVRIEYDFNWQKQHWKTLEAAYRTSPFFEYYEDEIAPLFLEKTPFLMDFNFKTIEIIAECIQLNPILEKTKVFDLAPENTQDYRDLVLAKKGRVTTFDNYKQVFDDKNGFHQNLSILDLLFNQGPSSICYLEQQKL